MLHIQNITKTFGTLRAVDDVSFSVAPGETFALLGPNGSGKTTLTRVMAGLLYPSEGEVEVDGASMQQAPMAAKRVLGYVPDNPEAWGRMTGHEFLHFIGTLYDMSTSTREERIAALLPRFGLDGIQHVYFDQYSRGNRQKFTILAAFLHEPKVLIIDEPIVGLDPDSVSILETMLGEFTTAGGAVVITTHTLAVAERVADRVGFLYEGTLRAVDTVDGLKATAGLEATATLTDVYRHIVHQSSTVE